MNFDMNFDTVSFLLGFAFGCLSSAFAIYFLVACK